jgi:hypothetical protein
MSTVSPPRVTSTLKPDLSNWDPEHDETWDSHLAWRTLWITTFSMTLGFAAWYLVSAIAPRLNDIGFDLSTSQLYWLVALPGLAAGLLRLLFMFLPPILGTRILVALSSALLLLPMIGWTLVARDVSTPYWVLLALSFTAGIGGGSFSGFMASTSYFFPKRRLDRGDRRFWTVHRGHGPHRDEPDGVLHRLLSILRALLRTRLVVLCPPRRTQPELTLPATTRGPLSSSGGLGSFLPAGGSY